MYQAFDAFLNRDTWYTGHAIEDEVFNLCLQKVVDDPQFSVERMAEYMRAKVGSDDESGVFANAIERRTVEAYAIRDFLKQTGR